MIYRHIENLFKELLYLLGIWQPSLDVHIESASKEFSRVNSKFWEDSISIERTASKKSKLNVLIEGHLSQYGPNYMFRTALAAKAIQDSIPEARIDVLYNGFSYQWKISKITFQSFKIQNWIFLGRKFIFINPIIFIISLLRAIASFLTLKDVSLILSLRAGKLKIGDLIYDQVIKSSAKGTIDQVNFEVFKVLFKSYFYYFQYSLLFLKNSYSFYITTHTAYPEYGILARVALKNGVKVIETTDIQMTIFDEKTEDFWPTYHEGIKASILELLKDSSITEDVKEKVAIQKLNKRFGNELDQIDSKKSFSGKTYNRDDLNLAIGNSEQKKIGFIFAHIFVDSPHLSRSMLFLDYYLWLIETIKICSLSKEMIWVVKPHPSSAVYEEEGKVKGLVDKFGNHNVVMCPENFNTKSIIDCADVITTVHGTVGLEMSCIGIPVILAGKPFYAGFGFTHEPDTVEDYAKVLQNAHTLEKLDQENISAALRVFLAWEESFDFNNPIYDSEVQASVWGSGVNRDLAKAYQILTHNLSISNPKDLKLWSFIKKNYKV